MLPNHSIPVELAAVSVQLGGQRCPPHSQRDHDSLLDLCVLHTGSASRLRSTSQSTKIRRLLMKSDTLPRVVSSAGPLAQEGLSGTGSLMHSSAPSLSS